MSKTTKEREWKWKTTSYGRQRVYKAYCATCAEVVWKRKDQILRHKNNFCTTKCHGLYNENYVTAKCANCSLNIRKTVSEANRSKTGNLYCSKSCAISNNNRLFKQLDNHPNWIGSSYRKHALAKHGANCQNKNCPLDNIEEKMLDVHHIDGSRSNNKLENLEVLCVWCHALETRKHW